MGEPLTLARSRSEVLKDAKAKLAATMRAVSTARADGNIPTENHYLAKAEKLTLWISELERAP